MRASVKEAESGGYDSAVMAGKLAADGCLVEISECLDSETREDGKTWRNSAR